MSIRKHILSISEALLIVARPLSSIGMPYYRDQLLSSWPSHLIFETGAPPPKIDQQFLSSLKVTEWGGYGRNNRTSKRNQVEDTRTFEKTPASLQAPKFLSEKAREASNDGSGERRSSTTDEIGVHETLNLKADVPVWYENVEIKYSKFGVDDFDFGQVPILENCKWRTDKPQILQQDEILWARDPHSELLCKPTAADFAFHSSHSQSCFTTHSNKMCQRAVPVV